MSDSLFSKLSTWPPRRGPRLVGEGVSLTVCVAYAVGELFDLFGEQLRGYLGDTAVGILLLVLVWSRVQILRTQTQSPEVDARLRDELDGLRESVADLSDLVNNRNGGDRGDDEEEAGS